MSDAEFTISRLTSSDTTRLRELNRLFARAFEDPENYSKSPPSDDYLRGWLGQDHVIVLVASRETELVGGLVAYELQKFEQERREIYLYDLGVESKFRRRGVATMLIDALRKTAQARGAFVVFVQADQGDDPAISLYSKLGKREEVLHFDFAVEKPPPSTKNVQGSD
ncbi:MAG: hypothetical protein SynsKO_26440 [Synoicihabitans sp.]